MEKRPPAITVVFVLMMVAAAGYLVGTGLNLWFLFQPEEQQQWFSRPMSDWYFAINAVLDAVLFIGFVWIGRLALRGDYGAGMTVTMLAVINLVFSAFSLVYGYGWVTMLASLAVLVVNTSKPAQAWYRAGSAGTLAS